MFSSLVAFFTGIFYVVIFGLIFVVGLFIVMGFFSAKGMFRRLKNGDMFKGGRAGYSDGYNHQSKYNEGYGGTRGRFGGFGRSRRDRYDDRYDDRRNEPYTEPYDDRGFHNVTADHLEYELGRYQANRDERRRNRMKSPAFSMNLGNSPIIKNFRSPKSFCKYSKEQLKNMQGEPKEDYIAVQGDEKTSVSSVKEILCGIYNESDTIVCNRQEIVEAVQTLQSGEIGSIRALAERSKQRFYQFGVQEKELFVIVKSSKFNFNEALAIDTPREFLQKQANVLVDENVKTTLLKTTLFDFKGDVHGCRFVFVGDLHVNPKSLATNLTQGSINTSVSTIIKNNEMNDNFEPVQTASVNKPVGDTEPLATEPQEQIKPKDFDMSVNTGIGRIQEDGNIEENKDTLAPKTDDEITPISIGKIGEMED